MQQLPEKPQDADVTQLLIEVSEGDAAAVSRLPAQDPNDQRARLGLADVEEVLGSVLSRRGKREEALRYFSRAIDARALFERLGRKLSLAALEREVTPVTASATAFGSNWGYEGRAR